MPDSVSRPTDFIIGRGLLSAESIAAELRDRLARELSRRRTLLSDGQLLALARDILFEFEPLLALNLRDTDLAGWIAGVSKVTARLPTWAVEKISTANAGELPPSAPPPGTTFLFPEEENDEPVLRFPLIERAAESLLERRVLTRDQFDRLSAAERLDAFTVARTASEEVLERIRDTLAETTASGASLGEFRRRLGDELAASFISPAHLENVYRTNVQAAYSDGHETIAQAPVVADLFPYQAYYAIRDGRVRPTHLALEELGLNGTNVYRRDDPFWDRFTPPWDYQCRCGVNLLTVEAAALAGVQEAREWLRSGRPPARPEWRYQFVPFSPPPGFGARRKMAA